MDASEIINALNRVLDIADKIDGIEGAGVAGITNGECTSRETVKLDLATFLLDVAKANDAIGSGEVALLNVVLDAEFSADDYHTLSERWAKADPSNMLSLDGFLSGDRVLNKANGTRETTMTNVLVDLFEAFGNVIVYLDTNVIAKVKVISFINGMKKYIEENL